MPKSKNEIPSSENSSFRRGFKTDAEKIAITCRRELSLKDFDPLPALKLAEHLKLTVISPDEIEGLQADHLSELISGAGANYWSAVTIGREKAELIIHNNSHSSPRKESNIMHEIAHVLLGHSMGEIDTSLGIPLRKFDLVQEAEAEWLGGCLQLPKPALVKYFVFNPHSIEQISEIFNASVAMVRYRIGVSGVQAFKRNWKRN